MAPIPGSFWTKRRYVFPLAHERVASSLGPNDVVVLSRESLESADVRATIALNIDFVNALFEELLEPEEIGAVKHTELFLEGDRLVPKQRSKLSRFLASAFFRKNDDRDGFNSINDQFYELEKTEDLEQLNSAWLKSRPGLCVVPASELQAEIAIRASNVSDGDSRLAKARASEPIYIKQIRSLCEAAGHIFQTVTAGDPTNEYKGRRILAWHFLTDRGHQQAVAAGRDG